MASPFPYRDATSPSNQWFDITPDDDEDLPQPIRTIWVGGTGDLALMGADGEVSVFKSVPAGYLFVVSPMRVMATDTDATDLVGQV